MLSILSGSQQGQPRGRVEPLSWREASVPPPPPPGSCNMGWELTLLDFDAGADMGLIIGSDVIVSKAGGTGRVSPTEGVTTVDTVTVEERTTGSVCTASDVEPTLTTAAGELFGFMLTLVICTSATEGSATCVLVVAVVVTCWSADD
jgi:hypothetical protein